jgi:toluene monooxygenase electron transfer component
LLDGEVDQAWAEAPGWKSTRAAKREMLLCQTRPLGDCRFALPRPPRPHALLAPASFVARVERSGRLTEDVVVMQVRLDRPLGFAPGQFVLLAAPGVPGYRAYSMVNAPDQSGMIELIAKRKPGGRLSELLFSNGLHDVEFRAFGPLGRAVFAADRAGDLLVVAGGTGLAGPLSILHTASAARHFEAHRAAVYFGVRRASDLFFLDRLSSLKERHGPALDITIALSEEVPAPSLIRAHPNLTFVQGLMHEAIDADPPLDLTSPSAYLAGPPLAVEAATRVVMNPLRIAPERIFFDRFN